ncbi:MAG: AbrB/MazE/SpoVT family DNA-binding domain-containing protein [Sphaerochaetaceae bacterium]|nr:AbrB/MazE/SpoVT family DNA-binding domain-containing protein [Sphaerochaetaceae bacterium]
MELQIKKWGNSQGIRIPVELLNETGLSVNDRLAVTSSEHGKIEITKIDLPHKALKAAGMLHRFADPELRKKEKDAFADAMKEKYGIAD